jgi:hypothetical protein
MVHRYSWWPAIVLLPVSASVINIPRIPHQGTAQRKYCLCCIDCCASALLAALGVLASCHFISRFQAVYFWRQLTTVFHLFVLPFFSRSLALRRAALTAPIHNSL